MPFLVGVSERSERRRGSALPLRGLAKRGPRRGEVRGEGDPPPRRGLLEERTITVCLVP